MNIGILGGSFDPIHNGHLHMAKSAYEAFSLDEVWLIPSGHSPNKNELRMTEAAHRFHMCELAAGQYDWLSVNSIEMDSSERSYTYCTLEKLTQQYPNHRFCFIMGGDSLDYFDTWVKPDRICELATILVIPRDQFDFASLQKKAQEIQCLFPCDIRIVRCEQYPLSSTQIRESLCQKHPNPSDFPPGVLDYIEKNHLYA